MTHQTARPSVPQTGEKITTFHVHGGKVVEYRVDTVADRARFSVTGEEFVAGGSRLNVKNLYPNTPRHVAPLSMEAGGFIYAREGDEDAAARLLRNTYAAYLMERAREATALALRTLETLAGLTVE